MRNLTTFALCCFGLVGCALLFQDVTEEVARGVVKYCDSEPAEVREGYRAVLRAELPEGYDVAITCPGDTTE